MIIFLPIHGVGPPPVIVEWVWVIPGWPRSLYLTTTVLFAGYLPCASPEEPCALLVLNSLLLWQHHYPSLKNIFSAKWTLKPRVGWVPKKASSLRARVQVSLDASLIWILCLVCVTECLPWSHPPLWTGTLNVAGRSIWLAHQSPSV